MSIKKFEECGSCYFHEKEPAICEGCECASSYESAELDTEGFEELRRIEFYDKEMG